MFYFVVEMEPFGAHVHNQTGKKEDRIVHERDGSSSAPCSWFKERAQNHFLVRGAGHCGVYREARYSMLQTEKCSGDSNPCY